MRHTDRRTQVLALVLVLACVGVASFYTRLPSSPLLIAQPAPPPSRDALKKAASYILSCDCGNSKLDPGYQESSKLLSDAGAALIPVLVELLGDDEQSTWFVNRAARCASGFPFSQPFCDALRLRRDDKRFDHDSGAMLGVFDYFAKFGDSTDLAWMEAAVSRLEIPQYAAASIQQLRERLSRK